MIRPAGVSVTYCLLVRMSYTQSPPEMLGIDDEVTYNTYSVADEAQEIALHEPPPDTPSVPEALVQDLWAHQRFETSELTTADGEEVQVLDPGRLNTDAGPDFQNAHVRIGSMDWRGLVEVHNTSGEWFEHDHHTDPRYDSVVLHVTLHPDMWTGGLLRSDETPLPEIVLYPRLKTPLRELLHAFHTRSDENALPCAPRWDEVPQRRRREWIHHLARRRVLQKRNRLPSSTDTPMEATLHQRLFRGLGYSKNDEPMTILSERVPPRVLRHVDQPRNREALLLGVAGLIPAPGDLLEADRATADYAMDLRNRFRRLRVGLDVTPMASTVWTFFRLRPNNFPPLRIAQAAAWYSDQGILSENPIPRVRAALDEDDPIAAMRTALESDPASFWTTHYTLKKSSSEHDPSLGRSRRDTLIVNAVAPILLLDAEKRDDSDQEETVLDALRDLPASRDSVVRRFNELGTEVNSRFDAQGLHQLYRNYCTAGGCLDCEIGRYLIDQS